MVDFYIHGEETLISIHKKEFCEHLYKYRLLDKYSVKVA